MLSPFGRCVVRFDLRHVKKADKGVRFGEVRPTHTDEMQESRQCKTKPIIWH